MSKARTISVVVPLFQARDRLQRVLAPLLGARERGELLEIIVVDDGSSDGGPAYCRELGLDVRSTGGRKGPAAARNVGAEVASGDVLLFVDSDVVIRDDVPRRVAATLAEGSEWSAVFGSYDDQPPARNAVSQYVNLRHHVVHQRGVERATTFWAGCGAVDAEAFRAASGFDAARYERPSIEDIELGYRLTAAGRRIRLDRELLSTHLKRWSLRDMVHTDVVRRALPWVRLMLERGIRDSNLNARPSEKAKALVALAFWASLMLAPLVPGSLAATPALLAIACFGNRDLFGVVVRRNGWSYGAAAFLLHQLYYTYSVGSFAYARAEALAGSLGGESPDAIRRRA